MSTPRAEPARLREIHAVAARFYQERLASDEGTSPRQFLARRGVPVDQQWVVGYAPDRPNALINELRRRGFNDVEIVASGLAATSPTGRLQDRFRDRVMVGVRDGPEPDAPVVGFVGYAPPRAAPDVASCLETPTTAIFRPRDALFGRAEQRHRTGDRLIIASDPLEAIALAARTAQEPDPPLVLAPASPSLTRRQVNSLARTADLSGGLAIAVRAGEDGQLAAERAHKLLARVVPPNKLLVVGPDGRTDSGRTLAEALVVARVDRAADAPSEGAEREEALRAAKKLATGQDPEVAARLESYARRRLGPEPSAEPALEEAGEGEAPRSAAPDTRIAPTKPELEQLAFDFEALARTAGPDHASEPPSDEQPAPKRPARARQPVQEKPPAPQETVKDQPSAAKEAAEAQTSATKEPAQVEQSAPDEPTRDEAPPEKPERADRQVPAEEPARADRPADPQELPKAPAEQPTRQPPPTESPPRPEGPRFRPTGQQDLAPSGEHARIEANLAAIRALKAQLAEGRPPTPEEQALYARWSGWGATPRLFDERDGVKEQFAAERAELLELLGEEGYLAARTTTLNAHYTDAAYVEAIWSAVRELGFAGGRFLEPGCGSGNFIGFAPEGAQPVGVELDPTTAAIAQALYPDAVIRTESFADTRFQEGTFDLTVGNVPFGSHKLADPDHNPGRRHSIHNHFILKSLRLTRPGGMVAVITSRYTMDGEDEAHVLARTQMAELADLVGAVRLPTDAHRSAADTEVVTDLLILRRREEGRTPDPTAWRDVRPTEVEGARDPLSRSTHSINEYFLKHPEYVLGRTVSTSGRFGPTLTVLSDAPTAPALATALELIVARAQEKGLTMTSAGRTPADGAIALDASDDQPDGTLLHVGDGRFVQIRYGRQVPHHPPKNQAAELRALIELRDTVLALLDEEATHEQDTWRMNELRVELNARYDRYVARYGSINRYKATESTRLDRRSGEQVPVVRRTYPRMGGFRDDPFFPYVSALEKFDDETQACEKADIFHKRVVVPRAPADRAASPDDALVITWDTYNEVRLDEIARLLGLSSEAEAREALGTLVFDEPSTGRLVRRSEYLSGNVRKKLADAERAAAEDPRFNVNVEALRAVVPRDLTPGEIGARLGSPWIDATYVQQFLQEILEDDGIRVSNVAARWSVEGGNTQSVLSTAVWGTRKRCAQELASNLLNSQTIEITQTIEVDGRTRFIKDEEATAMAQAKAAQLDDRFRVWLWEDPRRAEELVRIYNDRFNSLVPQSFDEERVSAPGLSAAYELRPHQEAAVARIRSTPGVGLFHGTGAGKTLEMIVGGMELRRLGLVQKPAYVVPKAVVGQFQREFLQAYPRARVLAVDSEDLVGDKRRQFVARCSTGNWDAVIISHTAFKKIPVSKGIRVAYLRKEQERLRQFLTNSKGAGSRTVKDLQKQLENLGERIKEELAGATDAGIEFQRTGIDYLFIDEAHTYKNLAVLTSIPELAHPGNQITRDLEMKLYYLRERYGRRVVTLATATPVDNSPSEILTMMKYAAPHLLEEVGITQDDHFHSQFIQTRRRIEMKPDGSGFQSRWRHSRYVNLPELKRLLHSFADVKLKKDLQLGEPAIVGGQPEILSVPASDTLRHYQVELAARGRAITGGGKPDLRPTKSGDLKQDNILWISTDGRMASLDVRMVGLETDEPQKIDVVADRMIELWRKHRDDVYYAPDGTPEPIRGSLQLAFCDLGIPNKKGWSFYEALRDELVARGMPAEQVRFAQEATDRRKKDQLQRDARDGKIAVLIGSRSGLGTGVNIQRRVVAVYQIDATWKLTPLEQSLGRGKRQGNENRELHHIIAITEGSYEPFLWQKVDDKARFTEALLDARDTSRTIDAVSEDDGGRIDPSVMFAVAAGRPELQELATVESALGAMRIEQRIWHDEQFTYKATIARDRKRIEELEAGVARLDDFIRCRKSTRGDAFAMTIDGRVFNRRPDAGVALISRILSAAENTSFDMWLELGELGNIPLVAVISRLSEKSVRVEVKFKGLPGSLFIGSVDELAGRDPTGLIRTFENELAGLEKHRGLTLDQIESLRRNIAQAEARVGKPFPHEAELQALQRQFDELQKALEVVEATPSKIEQAAQAANQSKPAGALGDAEHQRAPPEAPAAPHIPGRVSRGLPEVLKPARGAIADLEATLLTDPKLAEGARAGDKEELASIVQVRIDNYLAYRPRNNRARDLAVLHETSGSELRAYLVDRVWAFRELGGTTEAASPTPDALDGIDPEAARETLSIEHDKRKAIEAAREAAERAGDFEARADNARALARPMARVEFEERAAEQYATVAAEQRRLADLIEKEWKLFEDGRHLSIWMAKAGSRAEPPHVPNRPAETIESIDRALPGDAVPVEGVDGYHYVERRDLITVYGPDNTPIATGKHFGRGVTAGEVDGIRIPGYAWGTSDFPVLAARQHRAARLPAEQRDRVTIEFVPDSSARAGYVAVVRGTIKDNARDAKAVKKAGHLLWSSQRRAWVTGRKWTPEKIDENLTRLLREFADQGRNVVVTQAGRGPEITAMREPSPVVPGTVSTGLPESLRAARGAIAELEAAALTDLALTDMARLSPNSDFAGIVRNWLEEKVIDRDIVGDSPELASLLSRARNPTAADEITEYMVGRLRASLNAYEERNAHIPAPYKAQAELLGPERWTWVADRASALAEHSLATTADPALRPFEALDPAAARETRSVERDKRIALQATREANARAATFEHERDREAAAVERATAAAERQRLAQCIEREWRLFEEGRHLSQWMMKFGEAAAVEVASGREKGHDTDVKAHLEQDAVRTRGVADVHARDVADVHARSVPDAGVGIA